MSETDTLGSKFIMIIVFLGTFFLLVSLIPSEFGSPPKTYETIEYPNYFTKEDVERIQYYINKTVDKNVGYEYDFSAEQEGAPIFYVLWTPVTDCINVYHVTWKWWIFSVRHQMTPSISETYAISKWDSDKNCSKFFVKCNHIQLTVFLTDYNISRNSLSACWDDGKIHLGLGFGINDFEAKLSAWDITARLLTFQSPEIHPALNAIIAIPIWASIAYLLYRLILLVIPFVGG